jgi:hypothetical protein
MLAVPAVEEIGFIKARTAKMVAVLSWKGREVRAFERRMADKPQGYLVTTGEATDFLGDGHTGGAARDVRAHVLFVSVRV